MAGRTPHFPVGDPAAIADICTDTVAAFTRLHHDYGRLVGFPKGSDLTVFAFGPDANHTVFTDTDLYAAVGFPGPKGGPLRVFRHGLFALNGQRHHDHRRLLLPPLGREVVAGYAAAMTELTDRALDGWRLDQTLDLYAAMKEFSLAVTGKLLFGLDPIPESKALAAVFQRWLDSYFAGLFAMCLPVTPPAGFYEETLDTSADLTARFREIIRVRRDDLRSTDTDLLARLLQAQTAGRLTEDELIGEVHTLVNAAYQTTASALTFTLLMLATHPEVLGPIHAALEGPGRVWMPRLDAAVKEALRLFPPVILNPRQLTRPGELLGCELPAGTVVFTSFYVTHRLPETFADPGRFRPERWDGRAVSPYAYLPFGAGPRMCIGTTFAQQLFQIVIPAVVRRFRLELAPGTRVDRHASLTLGLQSLPVTVRPQDGRFAAAVVTGDIHDMVEFPPALPARIAA
jgi:cytochrome P450